MTSIQMSARPDRGDAWGTGFGLWHMHMMIAAILTTWVWAASVPAEPDWTLPTDTTRATARVNELILHADKSSSQFEQMDAQLAAANGLLSQVLAPYASRRVLGIAQSGDAVTAQGIVSRARDQLSRADGLLKSLSERETETNAQLSQRRERIENLQAFATVMTSAWQPVETLATDANEAERDALLQLAIAMEDNRKEIAETARLWKAYRMTQRGQWSRALDLLPPMLDPPRGDPSIAVYARVLRCRSFVAEHQGHAAAIALATRLEKRAGGWFDDVAVGAAARRTIAFARREMTEAWEAQLTEKGETDRAKWCAEAVARIDKTYFSESGSEELLPLAWAAPPIVGLGAPISPGASITADVGASDAENADDAGSAGFRGE